VTLLYLSFFPQGMKENRKKEGAIILASRGGRGFERGRRNDGFLNGERVGFLGFGGGGGGGFSAAKGEGSRGFRAREKKKEKEESSPTRKWSLWDFLSLLLGKGGGYREGAEEGKKTMAMRSGESGDGTGNTCRLLGGNGTIT